MVLVKPSLVGQAAPGFPEALRGLRVGCVGQAVTTSKVEGALVVRKIRYVTYFMGGLDVA